MGIQYKQIEEMIETGKTDKDAEEKILERWKASKHKRKPIPIYTFERKNYLLEMEDEK